MLLDDNVFKKQRKSIRVPNLFSFHYGEKVFVGRNISREGFGLLCPCTKDGSFMFHNQQKLRNCYMEIHATTIYFSKLTVKRLERVGGDYIYGICIDSILPAEKVKYLYVYDKKLTDFEQGRLHDRKMLQYSR